MVENSNLYYFQKLQYDPKNTLSDDPQSFGSNKVYAHSAMLVDLTANEVVFVESNCEKCKLPQWSANGKCMKCKKEI